MDLLTKSSSDFAAALGRGVPIAAARVVRGERPNKRNPARAAIGDHDHFIHIADWTKDGSKSLDLQTAIAQKTYDLRMELCRFRRCCLELLTFLATVCHDGTANQEHAATGSAFGLYPRYRRARP